MKKGLLAVLAIVVVVGGAAALMVMNNKDEGGNPSNPSSSNSDSDSSTNPSNQDQAVATTSVTIADMSFSPATITVQKGSTVTWTNQDSTPHTVTGDDSGNMDSDSLSQGDTYKFTFNETGTFTYHCNFHSDMTGKVIVTE